MMLVEVAQASADVAATTSRNAKSHRLTRALLDAGDDIEIVAAWLCGDLRQRRTGVGWATVRNAPAPALDAVLQVREVDAIFAAVSDLAGPGSSTARTEAMQQLFSRATEIEQRLLFGLISGEIRQGALQSLVVDAVAKASELPLGELRRAVMLAGDVAVVAGAALRDGRAGLSRFGLRIGRPILPMLAATAASVDDALTRHEGEVSVDVKLDGIRAQVHRAGSDISVFSRSLDDITARVPEIVSAVALLPVDDLILDGEAISLHADGRPLPFQDTGSRAATRARERSDSLQLFAFDVLHVDGRDLIDEPLRQRLDVLDAVAHDLTLARLTTSDSVAAQRFLDDQLQLGHEGVVVKDLSSAYDAGRRGGAWLKVKPVHTFDLVVLAVEWGHGRRKGKLSNLHLGARDPDGGWVMVGKTFKGLTDAVLEWQTEQLLARQVSADDWVVHVRPELVVEIAIDGVQRSTRYPGGVALRFARVVRYRDDKSPAEADPITSLQAMLRG